jgi:hypothetical protein
MGSPPLGLILCQLTVHVFCRCKYVWRCHYFFLFSTNTFVAVLKFICRPRFVHKNVFWFYVRSFFLNFSADLLSPPFGSPFHKPSTLCRGAESYFSGVCCPRADFLLSGCSLRGRGCQVAYGLSAGGTSKFIIHHSSFALQILSEPSGCWVSRGLPIT